MACTAKRADALESGFHEHGLGAVGGLVAKGARQPSRDGIGFHKAAASAAYGFQCGAQPERGDPSLAIPPENGKAGDAPEPFPVLGGEVSVRAPVVDARQLFAGPVLAPAHRLSVCVDEDAMCRALLDKGALLPPIAPAALGSRREPLVFGQAVRPVKMHALAEIPAAPLREQAHKIRPGLSRKFFRRVRRKLGRWHFDANPPHIVLQPGGTSIPGSTGGTARSLLAGLGNFGRAGRKKAMNPKRRKSYQAGGTSSIHAFEPPVASQMARCFPSCEGMAQPT